jgi:lipopolysaccharide assembly protein A
MRTIKLILLALILIGIVVLALANREPVTLNLLPDGMSRILPYSRQVPLFMVILASVGIGLVLGYLFEYVREHKHRKRAAVRTREARQLSREVDRLKRSTGKQDDDVLALLG